MSAYAKLPASPFKEIAFNAGVIASEFDVDAGALEKENILFATTGGSSFTPNLATLDLLEDVDNAKVGTKQAFMITGCDPHLTTTVLTVGEKNLEYLMPNSTKTTEGDAIKMTQYDGIVSQDSFHDLWLIVDYGTMTDKAGSTQSGYFAIHLKNCLNVNGLQPQTTKDGKTTYSVDFRAFYDGEVDDEVPYEVYYKVATASSDAA